MQMTLQKRCFSLEKKYPNEYQVSRETSQVTLLMVLVEMTLMDWVLIWIVFGWIQMGYII